MSKTIRTRGGRRRASPESALANGGHAITLDVMVRLQAIALPEADGGFTVVIPALGSRPKATRSRKPRPTPLKRRRAG